MANEFWVADEKKARRRAFWAGVRKGYAVGAFLWALVAVAGSLVFIGWKL